MRIKRRKSEGYHYILVWSDFVEGSDFERIMLTTSTLFPHNIALDNGHFKQGMVLKWNESQHFVNRLFIKFAACGPFTKVGELTRPSKHLMTFSVLTLNPKLK